LTVGTVNYTADQLLSVFNTPPAGNGLIVLAHQLIVAKLNVGSTAYTYVNALIAAADALVGSKVLRPVDNGYVKPDITSDFVSALGSYNEGAAGPGHCE